MQGFYIETCIEQFSAEVLCEIGYILGNKFYVVVVVVLLVFYDPSTLSGHLGLGQLTDPHCSWASLLGSLPVLSAHSFASS